MPLAKVSKLKYLYFYNIDDYELNLVCNGIKDANYLSLEYMAVVGTEERMCDTFDAVAGQRTATKFITNLEPFSILSSSCVGNIMYLSLQSNDIGNTTYIENEISKTKYALENLVNFSSLYSLRIERNNLTSLKGLEDKLNLEYLYAGYNKLGINETYTPLVTVVDSVTGIERMATNEDMGKDVDNALYALQYTTKLYYLYLKGNVDLKWIGYLANDSLISYLYCGDGETVSSDCINLVDTEVADIRHIIKKCKSNKSIPSKYWLSLLDENDSSLEVLLSNQSITKSQFESLGTYNNIKYLNLLNIKIYEKYNDDTDTFENLITDKTEINSLITNTLKTITNLQYLNLSAKSGSSLVNFNDITFLKGVKESDNTDDIKLIELGALGTSLSTKEKTTVNGITSWENYDNGLKLLENKRYGLNNDYYYSSLLVLAIDEQHINLGDIANLTAKLVGSSSNSYFYVNRGNLYVTSNTVLNTISNVENLTKIILMGGGSKGLVLNLTSLKHLTYFKNLNSAISGKIVLPEGCDHCEVRHCIGGADLSNVSHISYLSFGFVDKTNIISSLETIQDGVKIDYFNFQFRTILSGSETYFDFLETVYESRKNNLIISEIAAQSVLGYTNNKLTSLNGFQYIDDLQKLNLKDSLYKFSMLKDISCLSKFSNSLTYLALPDCSISNATVISKLTKLTYLDLQDNSLAPYIEVDKLDSNGNVVKDADGNIVKEKWWTVKEICDRLRDNVPVTENGVTTSKATVILKGNSSITDWTEYTKDTSKWSSSSNYGE